MKLPANLKFTQGAVTYDVDEAQVIPTASFQKDQVTFELASTLDQFNPTATVTLEGRATTGMRPTTSTATRGSFTAANGVATTAVPGLTVTPVYDLGLALTSDATVEVLAGDVPEIRGRVTLPDQAGLTAQELQVYPTINGKELAPVSLASLIDPSTGNLRYRPAEGELAAGPNTVSLRVQDQYGNVSAPIRVRVEVIGTLSFDTLKTASFRATKLTGQAQATIPPTGDWDVRVLDTRRANSRWQLQLVASPFRTVKGERLAGGLSYTDKEKTTRITTTPQTVYQGMARTQQPVTDVTATWKAGMGLHLDLNGNALPGDYQADLYWSLNDVPNP
ncbi:hypothetical protein [Levilactobacillus zymae]|uniref:hypothetical protein n=1 Tax=Levilactobacillus zymae TaxID=267363 RepID=UPI0028B2E939|nr:hypothetical protein [Levilactobacillus zymae]MDT6980261.1 hypothetical protein [Levilactobacillus zymae]